MIKFNPPSCYLLHLRSKYSQRHRTINYNLLPATYTQKPLRRRRVVFRIGTFLILSLMSLIFLLDLDLLPANKEYRPTKSADFFSLKSWIRQTLIIKRHLELKIRFEFSKICIARAERDSTRAETRFRLSPKRTNPFKSVGASVQSTACSRGVRISLSNAG